MQPDKSHSPLLTAVLGLVVYSSASSGGSPEFTTVPRTLSEELTALERTWKAGDGTRQYDYYVAAGRVADTLSAQDPETANAVAAKVLSGILSKKAGSAEITEPDFAVGATDLSAMTKLSKFLVGNDNASMEQRREDVPVLATVLGRVREEIVRDYTPKPVFANVASPVGVPGVAGMDPDAIADPIAREKYKADILENNLNNLTNKRQRQLHEMERELAGPIVGYMSRVAATDNTSHGIVLQAIPDARLTSKEKAQVMRALPH